MDLGEHRQDEPPVPDCDCRRCAVATRDDLRKDAERYRWLRKHYDSVNFEPGDHDGMDLLFGVPQGEVSADCDKTIDGLMNGANA